VLPEGVPPDVGHDVEEKPCGLAGIEEGKDVAMTQAGRGPELPEEPLGAYRRRQEMTGDDRMGAWMAG